MYGLLIEHRTLKGKRDQVAAIWDRYMRPAIADNPGHLSYAYGYAPDEDAIVAFQVYPTQADAQRFLEQPSYHAYLQASRPLLAQEPRMTVVDVRWHKQPQG